ncbi:MAG TPA: helix-turn-helix domain-containing protein [bacterium]|nr:helix-turn-helix domain-containing protein [bacterium]
MKTTTLKKAGSPSSSKGEFMPDFWSHIGMNIFHARLALKWTQRQLAQKHGVSLRRLHSVETAAIENVAVRTLAVIAAAPGLELVDLFRQRGEHVRV